MTVEFKVGKRMAGDAMRDRSTVSKYWDDKAKNPDKEPADIETSGFNPPATVGGLTHTKTDTTASDFMKSRMSSMFGGGRGGNDGRDEDDVVMYNQNRPLATAGKPDYRYQKPGVDDGKAWADKWSGSFRNDASGYESADKYIQYNKGEQVVDRLALAKTIDQRPIYNQARGDIYQSQWGGDMWKNSAPDWMFPNPLDPIKEPDLDGDKYLDRINDI